MGDAELLGLKGGGGEADAEALETAGTSFGFVLETLDLLKPSLMVVVPVNPRDAETVGMAFAFVFADFVFLAGVDVGIEIEDGGADVVLEHPLNDGGGTGSATSMEQHLMKSVWNDDVVLLLQMFLSFILLLAEGIFDTHPHEGLDLVVQLHVGVVVSALAKTSIER